MSAPRTATPAYPDIARGLGPELRDAAERIDAARTLPPDLVASMTERGLFRFWVPECYGGPEIPVWDGLATFTELARHNASAAWCAFIANTTALLAASLPPRWAQEIYGRPDAITGGYAQPVGRAVPVEGGLRVSGRWQWGSGTQHCTAVGAGCVLTPEAGNAARSGGPRIPFVFLDPADVTFIDNWQVLGIRGSGSCDYTATDAFVPEGRWVDLAAPTRHVDTPLYRFSLFTLLATGIGATSIGIADRMVEEFRALAVAKTPQNSSRVLAERGTAQLELARAEATVRSSRAFLAEAVDAAWQQACRGEDLTIEQRRVVRLAVTDATQRCTDAVNRLFRTAGGEAVYDRSPFERLLRDANTASQHAMAAERIYELTGRLALGLESDTRLL